MIKKQYIYNFLLLMLGLLVAIVISEITLRVFFQQKLYNFEKGLFKNSPEFGYTLTPNSEGVHSAPEYNYIINANSHGFRGKEPNFLANHRVMILGDSFGMGQGVAEGMNICDLSNSYFLDKQVDLDIFNTSLSGYSAVNQISPLKHYIDSYKPNIVILLFYWNDIGITESLKVHNGFLVSNIDNKWSASLREWLNTNSHLYCLIKKFFYVVKSQRNSERGKWSGLSEPKLAISANYISKMRAICENAQSKFVVCLIPLHGIFLGTKEFQTSKKSFIEKLKTRKIKYYDWSLELPKNKKDSLVFKVDHHWTEAGNIYFSNILSKTLTENLAINK